MGRVAVDPAEFIMEDLFLFESAGPLIVSARPLAVSGINVEVLVEADDDDDREVERGDGDAPDREGAPTFLGFRGGGGALLFVFLKTLMHKLDPVRRALSSRALWIETKMDRF